MSSFILLSFSMQSACLIIVTEILWGFLLLFITCDTIKYMFMTNNAVCIIIYCIWLECFVKCNLLIVEQSEIHVCPNYCYALGYVLFIIADHSHVPCDVYLLINQLVSTTQRTSIVSQNQNQPMTLYRNKELFKHFFITNLILVICYIQAFVIKTRKMDRDASVCRHLSFYQ